jgi:hypothetical protein
MASRAQTLYWNQLTDPKAACEYVRLYRDRLSATINRFAVARSVVGVAALGGWITTNIDPHIWAAVIVAVQIAEALQRTIPWAARFAGTNELCAAFDALLIEAQLERESIAAAEWDEEQAQGCNAPSYCTISATRKRKQGSSSFLKKRTKKLLFVGRAAVATGA